MEIKAPKNILIICTRRLGDVLLATPLVHTLHVHWPNTQIDCLVFKGTESILTANPEVHQILTIEACPKIRIHLQLIRKIFHAYDYSFTTLTSDRAILYAFLASRKAIGVLSLDKHRWWKRYLLFKAILFDNLNTHTVLMNLRLAEALFIQTIPRIQLHWTRSDRQQVIQRCALNITKKLVILHLFPKFIYKAWSNRAWWQLACYLQQSGYTVAFSGESLIEKQLIKELIATLPHPALNLTGQFTLSQLAYLLHRSQLYIGPDTVVTHMAAALGIPTIALFGPSNPVKWGPWPKMWSQQLNPYQRKGSQRRHNVYIVQGQGTCVPCFEEGCERHPMSHSRCLEQLSVQQVVRAISILCATTEKMIA